AVFARVELAVRLHHPAEVAGPMRPQQRFGSCLAAQKRLHGAHRADQALAIGRGKLAQHGGDLVARAPVEERERRAPARREREQPGARVLARALGAHQAAPAERSEHAAEVARVQVQLRAQLGRGAAPAPAELVEQPRLGQRMGAADEARAQGADAACVESVEAAHRVDLHARDARKHGCFCQAFMNSFDLTGKAALVTGGNGGIGLAMARALAQAGAALAIAGRDAGKNAAAAAELKALPIACDLKDADACRAMVDEAAGRLGRLDILVNNAGTNIRKAPQDYSVAEWREVLDTNLTSAFVASQAAYPHMRRAGGG